MEKKLKVGNQKGFTLLELIATMVIMSVMASVATQKLDLLSDTAADRALKDGIRELNVREALTWTDLKLTSTSEIQDEDVTAKMDTNLGPDYHWAEGPTATGGTLRFRNLSVTLTRTKSTSKSMGKWQ